ncbi:hypothetical protein EG68_10331 [Paragonimus skrjabini miyazakii]|uniref:Uncharacterized protein n=1 Tax=Paragonimus skrjabini miyazakii TaxID=59628 RepID=A0A8S9Y8I7_9TREM|nr:hypothetical protein EG68_10331 [Paragonimus skrjabini miyazakii]
MHSFPLHPLSEASSLRNALKSESTVSYEAKGAGDLPYSVNRKNHTHRWLHCFKMKRINRCDSTCGSRRRRNSPKFQQPVLQPTSSLTELNDEVDGSSRLSSLCINSNYIHRYVNGSFPKHGTVLKSNHASSKDPPEATCGSRLYVEVCQTVQPVCTQIVGETQQPALTLTTALSTVETDVSSSAAACCDTSHTPAQIQLVDTCTQPSSTVCSSPFSPKPDPSDYISTQSSLGAICSSRFGTVPSKSEFHTIQLSQLHLTQSLLSSSTSSVQYTVSENPATWEPTSKSTKISSVLTKSEQQWPTYQPDKVKVPETGDSKDVNNTQKKCSPCSQKPEGNTHLNTLNKLTTTRRRSNKVHLSHSCSNRNANPVIIHPVDKPATKRSISVASQKHECSSTTSLKRTRSSELPKPKSMIPVPRKNLRPKAATLTTSCTNFPTRKNNERKPIKLHRLQNSHSCSPTVANACDVQHISTKPKVSSREPKVTQTQKMASCGIKSRRKRWTSLTDSHKISANLGKTDTNTKPLKRTVINKDETSHFSGGDSSLTTAGIMALAETSDLLGEASIRSLDRELNRLCFGKNVATSVSSEHGRTQGAVGDAVSNRSSFITTEPSAYPASSVLHPSLSVCNFPTVPLWPPFAYLPSIPTMEDLLKFYHHIQHSPSPHPLFTAAYPAATTLMTSMPPSYHPWYIGASPDWTMFVKNQSNYAHPRRMRPNSVPRMVRHSRSRIPRMKV